MSVEVELVKAVGEALVEVTKRIDELSVAVESAGGFLSNIQDSIESLSREQSEMASSIESVLDKVESIGNNFPLDSSQDVDLSGVHSALDGLKSDIYRYGDILLGLHGGLTQIAQHVVPQPTPGEEFANIVASYPEVSSALYALGSDQSKRVVRAIASAYDSRDASVNEYLDDNL